MTVLPASRGQLSTKALSATPPQADSGESTASHSRHQGFTGWDRRGSRTEHSIVGGPLGGQFARRKWIKRNSVLAIDIPVIDKVVGLSDSDLPNEEGKSGKDSLELIISVS